MHYIIDSHLNLFCSQLSIQTTQVLLRLILVSYNSVELVMLSWLCWVGYVELVMLSRVELSKVKTNVNKNIDYFVLVNVVLI